jgi:hypothetical protein
LAIQEPWQARLLALIETLRAQRKLSDEPFAGLLEPCADPVLVQERWLTVLRVFESQVQQQAMLAPLQTLGLRIRLRLAAEHA